jgi:predicted RNase H-like nuclease (RuvC/YqgF family)
MSEIESLIRKIKRSKNRSIMLKNLDELLNKIKEENEILKLQLAAREKERDEYKKELDEIHQSISYRVGRWIAETRIGGWLKRVLRKYVWK